MYSYVSLPEGRPPPFFWWCGIFDLGVIRHQSQAALQPQHGAGPGLLQATLREKPQGWWLSYRGIHHLIPCMHICMCIYIYIYICVCVYMFICLCIYIDIDI